MQSMCWQGFFRSSDPDKAIPVGDGNQVTLLPACVAVCAFRTLSAFHSGIHNSLCLRLPATLQSLRQMLDYCNDERTKISGGDRFVRHSSKVVVVRVVYFLDRYLGLLVIEVERALPNVRLLSGP